MNGRWFALFLPFVLLAGCEQKAPKVAPSEAPVVPVAKPIVDQVTDFVDFTGRTDAKEAVDVRARVTGFLETMPFREGTEVRKGQLLFEIDPRPYQAQYDQALGQVTLYQAQLKLAKTTLARDEKIASTGGATAISQQQLDQDKAAVEEAEARVNAYKASLDVYKLNLGFTRVTSPIDGEISRYYLTHGNLVNQDQTLLTTVVSLDPMYVYFDMDEPTQLRLSHAINTGKVKRPENGRLSVKLGLQDKPGYPLTGEIDFFNNQFTPSTGSITVRCELKNPKPYLSYVDVRNKDGVTERRPLNASTIGMIASPLGLLASPLGSTALQALPPPIPADQIQSGVRVLKPGMFVRVRMPLGDAHKAILVADRAISTDQGKKYVNLIDAENKVKYQPVVTGALQDNGLREITEGLKADDIIAVSSLQQIRPRMVIRPDPVNMPIPGQTTIPAKDKEKKDTAPAKKP